MKRFLGACLGLLVTSTGSIALASDEPTPPTSSPPPLPAPAKPPPEPQVVQGDITPAPANPTGDAVELQRMRAMLSTLAAGDSGYRLTSGIVGLGLGAVTIPIGISMLGRPNSSQDKYAYVGGGAVLGAGIGSVLGGVLNLALSFDPSVRIHDAFERRMQNGVPAASNIAETEADWRTRAHGAESARKLVGGLAIGVGVLGLGVGSYYALSPRMGSYERPEQDGVGALFIVGGMISVIAGLQSFFWKSNVESSWEGYRGAKGIAKATGFRPQIGAAVLPGGGLFSLQSPF